MTAHSKPVIGLVGGIGAGKSAVAQCLADLGCVVVDSDTLGRAALKDPAVREQIVAWWGTDVLDASGEVRRDRLAAIVFSDPAERRRLEGLTHPWIETRRREQFAAAPPSAVALVIDAPLLLEAGLDAECDAIIYVEADRATRLQRVTEHRGWNETDLRRREESQMPLDAKRSRADHVIQNTGDLNDLAEQSRRTLNEIMSRLQAPAPKDHRGSSGTR